MPHNVLTLSFSYSTINRTTFDLDFEYDHLQVQFVTIQSIAGAQLEPLALDVLASVSPHHPLS